MCFAACEYEGRVYENGKEFRPPGGGPCIQCLCKVKHRHTLKRATVNSVSSKDSQWNYGRKMVVFWFCQWFQQYIFFNLIKDKVDMF